MARAASVAPCGNACPTPYGLPDTNYPIPNANVVFVAPSGTDTNAGTIAAPFATVSRAVAAVPAGGTVVLRGGTYRERIGSFSKPVSLQAYPHEKPWIDGSVIVTGWSREVVSSGAVVFRHDNWTAPELCRGRAGCVMSVKSGTNTVYTDGLVADSAGNVVTPATNPAAILVDQMFRNGVPLRQVTTKAAVGAGTFFVDVAAKQLFIGDDPQNQTIESTLHDVAFVNNAPTKILGVGFRKFGSAPSNRVSPAAVVVNGAGTVVQNSVVLYSSGTGLIIGGKNATLDSTIIARNGLLGAKSDSAVGLAVTGSWFLENNTEGFASNGAASVASGFKITNTSRQITAPQVRNNVFLRNNGVGLWFDVGVDGAVAANNAAFSNRESGIFYEISKNAMIAGNLAVDNGTGGNQFAANIRTTGSFNVTIANNTVSGALVGIGVYSDGRGAMSGISITNNVIANVTGTKAALNVQAASPVVNPGIAANPAQWLKTVNGNVYIDNAGPTTDLAIKAFGSRAITYATVVDAQGAGFEALGHDSTTAVFVDPPKLNFHLATPVSGAQVPAPVASAIAPGTPLARSGATFTGIP